MTCAEVCSAEVAAAVRMDYRLFVARKLVPASGFDLHDHQNWHQCQHPSATTESVGRSQSENELLGLRSVSRNSRQWHLRYRGPDYRRATDEELPAHYPIQRCSRLTRVMYLLKVEASTPHRRGSCMETEVLEEVAGEASCPEIANPVIVGGCFAFPRFATVALPGMCVLNQNQ